MGNISNGSNRLQARAWFMPMSVWLGIPRCSDAWIAAASPGTMLNPFGTVEYR